MSIETLMNAVNQRSTSLFDSIVATSGHVSTLCFRDMVKCAIAQVSGQFDQSLVQFVYLEEGDVVFLEKQLLNMTYAEIFESEELMKKVKRLKSTVSLAPFFKGTRKLDHMLHRCAYLSMRCAIQRTSVSSRDAGVFIGCSKDTYIDQFQVIVDRLTDNLSWRLHKAEQKILSVINDNS